MGANIWIGDTEGPAVIQKNLETGPESLILRFGDKEIDVEGNSVAICRCGKSQRQPLCDGSHLKKEDE